jgi:hypothetical protein
VTIIAFLLPAGGAVVTVWNLHRFSQLDSVRTRHLTIAVVAVFAFGIATLLGLTPVKANSAPAIDANASSILSVGVAIACFVTQRSAYRSWRAQNARTRTSPWPSALGWALLFTLLTVIVALPPYVVLSSLLGTGPIVGMP